MLTSPRGTFPPTVTRVPCVPITSPMLFSAFSPGSHHRLTDHTSDLCYFLPLAWNGSCVESGKCSINTLGANEPSSSAWRQQGAHAAQTEQTVRHCYSEAARGAGAGAGEARLPWSRGGFPAVTSVRSHAYRCDNHSQNACKWVLEVY